MQTTPCRASLRVAPPADKVMEIATILRKLAGAMGAADYLRALVIADILGPIQPAATEGKG